MINLTPLSASFVPQTDRSGREVVVAIVKGTFALRGDGRATLADEQRPVRLNDVPRDPEDVWSSLLYPSDLCVEKRGACLVVVGEAISPRPVTVMDLAVKVDTVTAPLRVHGPRVYYRSMGRVEVGPAARFERVPVVYEKAYGGVTADGKVLEERNPSGVGVARSPSDLVDRPAPQIEHPAHPIQSAADRPAPVGYGAIPSHWSPRRERAGTLDEAWRQTRMPLLPLDFDVRHHNVAHPSLVLPAPLEPGAPISILGMTPEGLLRFLVPALGIVVQARFDGRGVVSVRPPIDTVLVEPTASTIEVTARQAFPIGRGREVLRELRVDRG